MKQISLLIASHALLLGAGYGWHRAASDRLSEPAPLVSQAARETPKPIRRQPENVTNGMGETLWKAGECHKAWKALHRSGIPLAEIGTLRRRILSEWAMKDLHSALIAWSDSETLNSSDISNSIQRAFVGHEEEMMEWIHRGDFGLDGSELLFALVSEIQSNTPDLLMKLMPKIPEELQKGVMQGLFGEYAVPGPDRATLDDRIAGIANLPDERLQSLAWQAALKSMALRGDDQFYETLARDDLPEGVHPAALDSLAGALAYGAEPSKAMAQFRKLSPADQSAIGPALLKQAKALSYARPAAVTNALTMLADSGQWQLLAAEGPEAVEHFFHSAKPNPESVSRWAMQLPARPETAETYRNAVGPRLVQDLSQGAEWVRTLPAGWHREQALAELAITANADPKDSATRDAAMAEITDSAIQAELREWLQNHPVPR